MLGLIFLLVLGWFLYKAFFPGPYYRKKPHHVGPLVQQRDPRRWGEYDCITPDPSGDLFDTSDWDEGRRRRIEEWERYHRRMNDDFMNLDGLHNTGHNILHDNRLMGMKGIGIWPYDES